MLLITYFKIPVLRLPLGLSRSGLISGVVLIADVNYKDWKIGF